MWTPRIGSLLGAALLALPLAASAQTYPAPAYAQPVPMAPLPVASHMEAGVLQEVGNGQLALTPYENDRARYDLQLGWEVPVFQGNGRVTPRALLPHQAVRVYFNDPLPGQLPRVTSIEILNPEEAQRAWAEVHPRKLLDPVPVPMRPLVPQTEAFRAKQAVLAQATGSATGTLERVNDEWLVVRPYCPEEGDARLRVRWELPVFAGLQRLPMERLVPGADVRVYYRPGWNGRLGAVAVELLTPDEANTARVQASPRPVLPPAAHVQAGRVVFFGNGYLVVNPFELSTGDARLRFEGDVPVYSHGMRVAPGVLTPGTDVRVSYEANRVVSVEVLSERDARRMEHEAEERSW